jgi:hypothetical protein
MVLWQRLLCVAPPLIIFVLVLTILSPVKAQGSASQVGTLTDAIDVSDQRNEKAHRFASQGRVIREMSGDFVGAHDLRRVARTVQGRGSWISYQVKVQTGAPITLEFEEIENREAKRGQDDVRGYSVLVDGQRAYFRTARNSGAGPLHFFVQVPARTDGVLHLKLQNEAETPFRIARIWAFSNFSKYFENHGLAVPYHLAPTFRPSFNDFEVDRQKLQAIKTSLGNHPHARPAWTTWLNYANLSDREIGFRLDYILRLAQTLDLPVQISFDTWWGSTPNGVDGLGGFWGDVPYQQVVYNQTIGQYQLSIPNRWGNTPWLSLKHPRLNAFKILRLQTAMRMLQERQQSLQAQGRGELILAINLDNEPVYWATGNAGLGNDILQADFSPLMVDAARQDKLSLNPADGLDFVERLWLRRQLLNYHEQIGSAAVDASREAISVNSTGSFASGDGLRHNIYTQAWVANASLQFPMQSETYPLWEVGAPASVRVGGEWNGDSLREREAVLHQLPLGRTAQVNAESGGRVDEMVGVRPGYTFGQRYYTLYNYPLDKMDVAASQIADTTKTLPTPIYERLLREETFDEAWKSRVVDTQGLQRGLIGNTTAMALYPTADANKGWLTYRIESPGQNFDGLTLELSGRAFVSREQNPNVFIRVLAGTVNDVAAMSEVGRLANDGDINAVHRFDISRVARGEKAVFVRIELDSANLPASVLSWCAIYHLRFTQPWPHSLLNTGFAQDESLETQRQQNLLVSWRRDAELAIQKLESVIGKTKSAGDYTEASILRKAVADLTAARTDYARGEYAAAYQLANQTENWLAPGAIYRVQESGRLSPYPIVIKTAVPMTFTLKRWNKNLVEFSLQSDEATTAQIQVEGLRPRQSYILRRQSNSGEVDHWQLRLAQPGDSAFFKRMLADKKGSIEWAMPVGKVQMLTESVLKGISRGAVDLAAREFSFWREDGQGIERIKLAAATAIMRGEAGQLKPVGGDELQRGDDVTVHLSEDGIATQILAETKIVEGIVEEVGQLTPYAMPFVRLQGSPIRHIIDLSAPLSMHGGGATGNVTNFRSVPLGSVNLHWGDWVKLRLQTKSARVFELWKNQLQTP